MHGATRLGSFLTLAILGSGCGLLPTLPAMPTLPGAEMFPLATLPSPFDAEDFAGFPGPAWNLPDIPEGVLKPLVGVPPQWWNWVPIHPSLHLAGEHEGGFHYLVDVPPKDMLAYYKEALRSAGWAEGLMGPLESGDYSYLTYERYENSATIYISPRDGGSLVSILVE